MRKLILAITTAATLLPLATPADARHHRRTTHYYSHRTRACPGHSGTTGAIVGGGAGALVGGAVTHGLAGPVIGGVGGALLGRHIGRHTC
jgi:hypothetical protein